MTLVGEQRTQTHGVGSVSQRDDERQPTKKKNGPIPRVFSGSSMTVLGKVGKNTKAGETRMKRVKYCLHPFFYVLEGTVQHALCRQSRVVVE